MRVGSSPLSMQQGKSSEREEIGKNYKEKRSKVEIKRETSGSPPSPSESFLLLSCYGRK